MNARFSLLLLASFSATALALAGEAPATAAPPPAPVIAPAAPASAAATAAATAPASAPAPSSPAAAGPNPAKPVTAPISNPRGAAVDRAGNLYVVNYDDGAVLKITPAGTVVTVVGTMAPQALSGSSGMCVDSAGTIFVAEADGAQIRKITPEGVMSVVAIAAPPAPADGAAAAPALRETLFSPTGVAVDAAGNLYVCDNGNSVIRKITPAGVMTTLAGKAGQSGNADGAGDAARFAMPRGIAADAQGTVYVADEGNSNIRKITPAGVVTTLAGKAGEQGQVDGPGATATFAGPRTLTVAADGTVYVADTDNNCIRKITPAGVVSTLAGQDMHQPGATDGTGSEARFAGPRGIAVDGAGNVYVADSDNSLIRRVTPAGAVTTVAGTAAQ